jgi:hypothetical protein
MPAPPNARTPFLIMLRPEQYMMVSFIRCVLGLPHAVMPHVLLTKPLCIRALHGYQARELVNELSNHNPASSNRIQCQEGSTNHTCSTNRTTALVTSVHFTTELEANGIFTSKELCAMHLHVPSLKKPSYTCVLVVELKCGLKKE